MLGQSQPLDSKLFGDLKFDEINIKEHKIKSQCMGRMFSHDSDIKITILDRLSWLKRDVRGLFYDAKYTIRNYFKWAKTIAGLRPWDGFNGVLTIVQKHLQDYLETEEKYGHAEESYKADKITSVKECLEILKRLQNDEYAMIIQDEIHSRYPKYEQLITKYDNSTSYSGDFYPQGKGWVGMESGSNPRRGYFEFINDRFELVDSPNQTKTNQILEEIVHYHEEVTEGYKQAQINIEKDMKRLGEILNNHFFQWWD